jgi:nicotinamide riboside kinase
MNSSEKNVTEKILRITITGTESTGKTTVGKYLAGKFDTVLVPDVSRMYVEQLSSNYNYNDVLRIARVIIEAEDEKVEEANGILLSDNCLVNIEIWLRYYKFEVPEWLKQQIENRKSDLYLLCDIDVPWQKDPLRNNAHDRADLLQQFEQKLISIHANFKLVQGEREMRLANATQLVSDFIRINSL